jgi:hypothetical protein
MIEGVSPYIGDYPGLRPMVPAFYRAPRSYRFAVMRAARLTGYGYSEIIGGSRERSLSHIRWAIMIALRKRGLSTPLIGRLLGGRDHTTVMHGLQRGAELVETDPDFATLVSMVSAA